MIPRSALSTCWQHHPLPRFYEPDLGVDPDSPFVRDAANKLVRRGYWMDMDDRTLVMVMVNGIGAHLTNDEKRAHLVDLRREHLIDQCAFRRFYRPKKSKYRCRNRDIYATRRNFLQRLNQIKRIWDENHLRLCRVGNAFRAFDS